MSVTLVNLDEGAGVVFVCEGDVAGQEIIQANRQILLHKEKLKRSRYCIIDYSKTTHYQVSSSEIEIIAEQDKEIATHIEAYLVAVVANRGVEFGFSRMWQSIIEANGLKWETMVFKERSEAENWIKGKAKKKYGIHLAFQ